MTFRSWGDVPAGMPVHHHCVVSIERSHDPKRWVDASTEAPDLVSWQYPDAVAWVYDQLVKHRDEATAGALQESVDERLDGYLPAETGTGADHYRYRNGVGAYCPTIWERLPQTFQSGRWAIEAFQLGIGRKLVLQILGYADRGQPAGVNGKTYAVCDRHQRPAELPYLGLTRGQAEHFGKYASLYVPA